MRQLLTPRLPRLRYDRILWVLGVFFLLLFLLSSISRKRNSITDKLLISIEPLRNGASLITEPQVRRAIQKGITGRVEGANWEDLDCNRIETFLETDPFIQDANVYLDINNHVRVDIEQREPVLRILDNQGGNYYLDAKGARIPISRHYTARVMVCTGNIPAYTTDFKEQKKHILKDLMTLTQRLDGDAHFEHFFQQIHVTNKDEFILTPIIGDQTVMIGSLVSLEDKLEKLKIFYKEVMSRTGWQQYQRLDLRYRDQVVAVK